MAKLSVSQERAALLNQGAIEGQNLADLLSLDFKLLLKSVAPSLNIEKMDLPKSITKRLEESARCIIEQTGYSLIDTFMHHPSDMIRSIACYMINLREKNLKKALNSIMPLADDAHWGVREWAWLALRKKIIDQLPEALTLLEEWVHNPSERIRRFATESTRPRGVWCAHILTLKQTPWIAEHLLDPLKSDPAKYVQLSVGNWLNDAGKNHPTWVVELCDKWQKGSPTKETEKICKRALRTINKKQK